MTDVNSLDFPILHSYWVIPSRLLAGEYPGSITSKEARAKIRWLLRQNVRFFIDLTYSHESDLQPYDDLLSEEAAKINAMVTYKRISLKDFGVPSQEEMVAILDNIDLALYKGENVYLHCLGGNGRTGTVVGCYLVRRGMAGAQALEKIRELRKDMMGEFELSPETEGQRRMVLEWIKGL